VVEISVIVYFEFYKASQITHISEHVGRRHAFMVTGYICIQGDLIPTKSVSLFAARLFFLYKMYNRNISRMRSKKALRVRID
jgi:hypothetical protein